MVTSKGCPNFSGFEVGYQGSYCRTYTRLFVLMEHTHIIITPLPPGSLIIRYFYLAVLPAKGTLTPNSALSSLPISVRFGSASDRPHTKRVYTLQLLIRYTSLPFVLRPLAEIDYNASVCCHTKV
jgi:hypothetical protein